MPTPTPDIQPPTPEQWARLYHAEAVPMRALQPGERFYFPAHPSDTMVAQRNGWYRDAQGRRFRTGMRSAVVRER